MFRRTLQATLTPVIGIAAVMGSVSGCSHVVGAPTMRAPMSNYMAARGFAPAVENLADEDDEILAGVPVTAAPLKAGTFMGARRRALAARREDARRARVRLAQVITGPRASTLREPGRQTFQ